MSHNNKVESSFGKPGRVHLLQLDGKEFNSQPQAFSPLGWLFSFKDNYANSPLSWPWLGAALSYSELRFQLRSNAFIMNA